MVDPATFERYVQEALDHLFDPADLLVHPLATLLLPRGSAESPGPALHRTLRDAIAQLKPRPDAPVHSPAWRSYRYLSLRYVEMLTIGQVASELGISPRQCRRDHHDALSAVAAILWDQYRHVQAPEATAETSAVPGAARPSNGDETLLEAELGKMGATSASLSDPRGIVESVVGTLAALAARKSVHFQLDLPPSLPLVAVDRTVLRQLLLELLLDAIDRGSGGRVTLAVDALADRVRARVVVREALVATRSLALGDETRREVSRRLADLQGIDLTVEDGPDGLATVLSLPSGPAPTVLIVDDNADVIHMFRHYLEGVYDVQEATSGEQALELAREVQPRAITLDVMMPAQDGWEVLQTLKHDPATRHIPIIVCSVLRERELALSLGAEDFLAKPITGQALVAALRRFRLAPLALQSSRATP
jgi:CheY-like chemotaxis protein